MANQVSQCQIRRQGEHSKRFGNTGDNLLPGFANEINAVSKGGLRVPSFLILILIVYFYVVYFNRRYQNLS